MNPIAITSSHDRATTATSTAARNPQGGDQKARCRRTGEGREAHCAHCAAVGFRGLS